EGAKHSHRFRFRWAVYRETPRRSADRSRRAAPPTRRVVPGATGRRSPRDLSPSVQAEQSAAHPVQSGAGQRGRRRSPRRPRTEAGDRSEEAAMTSCPGMPLAILIAGFGSALDRGALPRAAGPLTLEVRVVGIDGKPVERSSITLWRLVPESRRREKGR